MLKLQTAGTSLEQLQLIRNIRFNWCGFYSRDDLVKPIILHKRSNLIALQFSPTL